MSSPLYISDTVGSIDDRIRLFLDGDEIKISESWNSMDSVMEVPCAWSMRLGWGGVAKDILKRYQKGSAFLLYVGSALQMTGRLDALRADQPAGGALALELSGRDAMAPLNDTHIVSQQSFNDLTYFGLVSKAIAACPGIAGTSIEFSNAANRQIKAGTKISEVAPLRTAEQVLQEEAGSPTGGSVTGGQTKTVQAKVGESWLRFLRRYLDRAGLFLWAASDGTFVLSEPNGKQPPVYRIVRQRGEPTKTGDVVGMAFQDDVTHRHSEAVIFGRGAGRKHGPVKAKGSFSDQEMIDLGYEQPIAFKDANTHSDAEAAFFARRKLAEERRAGYRLEYTIAGLRLPLSDGSGSWAVVTPDTTVQVDDLELGISSTFYIDSVRRTRSPATLSTIRLMRLGDLVFGSDETE
jgi:prophage tail gpP-like protein